MPMEHQSVGGEGVDALTCRDQHRVRGVVVTFVKESIKYCDMRRLGRGDGHCPHEVLQCHR